MDGPKYDRIEISAEAKAKWEAEEGWKTAPGIEEKDPDGHFRVLGINPDVYKTLAPRQQQERLRFSFRRLANTAHPDLVGGSKEQMQRVNEARDALAGKTKPQAH